MLWQYVQHRSLRNSNILLVAVVAVGRRLHVEDCQLIYILFVSLTDGIVISEQ